MQGARATIHSAIMYGLKIKTKINDGMNDLPVIVLMLIIVTISLVIFYPFKVV